MISLYVEVCAQAHHSRLNQNNGFLLFAGGTAGLVLGNRLSDSGSNRVLVLETGLSPEVVAAYEAPGGNQLLAGTAIDWGFYTAPQEHLNGRILPYYSKRAQLHNHAANPGAGTD